MCFYFIWDLYHAILCLEVCFGKFHRKLLPLRGFQQALAKHSNTKAFENLIYLLHLNNKYSSIIKTMPLVMNICNQGWICWDGCITKRILCLACIFFVSCYHYISAASWFLGIAFLEPEKSKPKVQNITREEVFELIVLSKSHIQVEDVLCNSFSVYSVCAHRLYPCFLTQKSSDNIFKMFVTVVSFNVD